MSNNIPNNTRTENESIDINVTNPVATLQSERFEYGYNHHDCFPAILHDIISDNENSDIVTWLPSGTSFLITDKKQFAQSIFPRYFPQMAKYTSFTRKLARWGFQRVSRGPYIGSYYHESFIKGDRQKCYEIFYNRKKREETRNRFGQNHSRMASNVEGNPPIHPFTVGNDHPLSNVSQTNLSQTRNTSHPIPQFRLNTQNIPHNIAVQIHAPTQFPTSHLQNTLRQGFNSNNRYIQSINANASSSTLNVPQPAQMPPFLWNNLRNSPLESQMTLQMPSDSTLSTYLRLQLQEQLTQQQLIQQQLQQQLNFHSQVQGLNLLRQQDQQNTAGNNKTSEEDEPHLKLSESVGKSRKK